MISTSDSLGLVRYSIANGHRLEPPGGLLEYVMAGNGLWVRGQKPNLTVCFPLRPLTVRGLTPLQPEWHFNLPKVPRAITAEILTTAQNTRDTDNRLVESLYYLGWDQDHWQLTMPAQHQARTSVRPHATDGDTYQHALIELHSHHELTTFFSTQDNHDEQGFRIYSVIGDFLSGPRILTRIGLYGHFLDIDSATIFELPANLEPITPDDELTHV